VRVSLHPEADTELLEAAVYYAEAAGKPVAEHFLAEFDRAVELLRERPGLGTSSHAGTRKLPLRKFPFNIVYYERRGRLRILAVAHQRRRPAYWRDRAQPRDKGVG